MLAITTKKSGFMACFGGSSALLWPKPVHTLLTKRFHRRQHNEYLTRVFVVGNGDGKEKEKRRL